MKPKLQVKHLLYFIVLMLALWPILGNPVFITNDGPCHLYNASTILDILGNSSDSFFSNWYDWNTNPEPNWSSHFVLAVLQLIFSGIIAEKVFLSIYVLGFFFGFRYLVKSVYPENEWLVFLALPFIFHKIVLMGFYNNSLSIVVMFWVLGFWCRIREKVTLAQTIKLMLLLLGLYFTHPNNFVIALVFIAGTHIAGAIEAFFKEGKEALFKYLKKMGFLFVAVLPSLSLLLYFIIQKGLSDGENFGKTRALVDNIWRLDSLVLFSDTEALLAHILSILILAITLGTIFVFRKEWKWQHGAWAPILFILYLYFNQPTVAKIIPIPARLEFLPHLFMVVWISLLPWSNRILKGFSILGLVIGCLLLTSRFSHYATTSDAANECLAAAPYIKTNSTLLPINYEPAGRKRDNFAKIEARIWLFMHVADYLGAIKPLVIFDNYEAHTNWFPLQWKPFLDPYVHLGVGPGIEGWVPQVDISKYEESTQRKVDYVLLWCLSDELQQNKDVKSTLNQLDADYQEAFRSEFGRVRLYEKKSIEVKTGEN